MKSTMRWLSAALWVLVISASASAAQHAPKSGSPSHKSTSTHRNSHPSHPMRNSNRKHHAFQAKNAAYLPVGYLQPQQSGSATPKNTSAPSGSSSHSSSASSKKKKSNKKSKHARREPLQKAPTPERISEIQSSLARNGYYQGDPNGKWDANTVAAMQKFQSANGLDASGKLDAPSLQKLGLGSGIAGVSAPRPPCCSSTPHEGSSCCSGAPAGNSPAPSTPAGPAKPAAAAPGTASSSSASSASAPAANASTASNAPSAADPKTSQR